MATQALDLATIGFALHVLEEQHLGNCAWRSGNSEQERFLEWYRRNRGTLTALDGLNALASKEYTALNTFLAERGFTPQFEPLGVQVAARQYDEPARRGCCDDEYRWTRFVPRA